MMKRRMRCPNDIFCILESSHLKPLYLSVYLSYIYLVFGIIQVEFVNVNKHVQTNVYV